MRSPLPAADDFSAFEVIELDVNGALLHDGIRLPASRVADLVRVPPASTDVFVFMHGWQNPPGKVAAAARRLFSAIRGLHREQPERYPAIGRFRPHFIAVRGRRRAARCPTASARSATGRGP